MFRIFRYIHTQLCLINTLVNKTALVMFFLSMHLTFQVKTSAIIATATKGLTFSLYDLSGLIIYAADLTLPAASSVNLLSSFPLSSVIQSRVAEEHTTNPTIAHAIIN